MNVVLEEGSTWYNARREPTVEVILDCQRFVLSMADARLCCLSAEHCRNVLTNLAEQAGANRAGLADAAADLMGACRKASKWKAAADIKTEDERYDQQVKDFDKVKIGPALWRWIGRNLCWCKRWH